MEHRIEQLDGFKVVGFDVDCTHEDISGIPPLWEKFVSRMDEFKDLRESYGVCFDQPGGFKYVVGAKIIDAGDAPDGMRIWEVPGARYAVFHFLDKVTEMSRVFDEIFKEHLPAAGLAYDERGAVLERYPDDCWEEETGKMHADLMIPVK